MSTVQAGQMPTCKFLFRLEDILFGLRATFKDRFSKTLTTLIRFDLFSTKTKQQYALNLQGEFFTVPAPKSSKVLRDGKIPTTAV